MKTRRDFLKISTAGILGSVALGTIGCESKTEDKKKYGVGLQLYTIRDAMSGNLRGTLKRVSEMGYKNLELANYANGKFYGYAPTEFKKIVSDLGMDIISSHTQVEAQGITVDNAKRMADDHAALNVKYCVQPWINAKDRNIETYKRMIADWNQVGEIMQKVDIQFAYHNHNFEFKDTNGIIPYFDIFMPEMDKNLITMELDMFWVSKAGYDPVDLIKKYPGRFQLYHFKDMAHKEKAFFDVTKDDITAVGEGVIDFASIMNIKDIAGMKYMFVEDDNQGNGRPFQAIKTSINNITTKIL